MKRLFTALLILSAAGSAHAVTEISSCTDITLAGTAVITQDLDCSADPLSINLTPYGILDFQGHTVINANISCSHPATFADANCNIEGPGTLHGQLHSSGTIRVRGLDMINGRIYGARATVQETTITGPAPSGCAIHVETNYASSLKVIDTIVTGANCGVLTTHNTTIRGSKFLENTQYGVRVRWSGFDSRLRIKDSEASGNGTSGFEGTRISIKNSKFNDNGEHGLAVIYAHDEDFPAALSARGCEATGNAVGIGDADQKSTSISDCLITGNSLRGVSLFATRARLRDSIITGNGFAAGCDDPEMRCADVSSSNEPTLDSDTTCDTSRSWYFPTENWGVCSTD
jgi:hypothetical protein